MKLITNSNKNSGFTLTELLIVVTIIVILGLTILISINPMAQIFKGYDARRKSDLAKIKIALEAYYSDHDCYPTKDVLSQCGSAALKPYLDAIPCDPNTKKPYTIYLVPNTSTCPQQFAVYAQIYSFFDASGNNISYCPKTMAISSPGMLNADITYGCSSRLICPTHYGCKNGACVVVSQDELPACSPSFCDSLCSPIKNQNGTEINCQTVDPDTGGFVRECVAI